MLEPSRQPGAERFRHAGEHCVVVDQHAPVLVAHRDRERDPHADLIVGGEHPLHHVADRREVAVDPCKDVLDGGHSGLEHLEGGVERVQIGIDRAGADARDRPHLQRFVERAQLNRCHPDMMMGVHEPRQDDVATRANPPRIRIPAPELLVRANGGNALVFDEYAAVGQDGGVPPPLDLPDHGAAADERFRHRSPPSRRHRRREAAVASGTVWMPQLAMVTDGRGGAAGRQAR